MNEECIGTIIRILEKNGVYLYRGEYCSRLELDSITYISIIVDLEEEFQIEFSDEVLILKPMTIMDFYNIVKGDK